MMWSKHSRRIDPISRSAKPFCQGEAVPVDERLGADDCKNLKDRREPAIKLDKEPVIAVCELNTATQLAPQRTDVEAPHAQLQAATLT